MRAWSLLLGGVLLLGAACEKRVGGSFSNQNRAVAPRADARARARPKGPVHRVLYFTAEWCPTCYQLKYQVWMQKEGKALLAGARFETVDFDKASDRVARHSVTSLPTTVFLGAQGVEKGRIEGYPGKSKFLAEAEAFFRGRDLLPVLADELARQPKNLALRYRVGRLLLGRGRVKEAYAHYDQVLAADPKEHGGLIAKVYMHRARYLVRVKRDYPAAVAYLRGAVKRVPSGRAGESLRWWLGHALCLSGKPGEAVRVLDGYVKERQSKASALLLAAGLRRKCRGGYELDKGLAQAQAAVRAKPKNDWGWYLVAALAHRLKKHALARQAIARAARLDPESAFYAAERKRFSRSK